MFYEFNGCQPWADKTVFVYQLAVTGNVFIEKDKTWRVLKNFLAEKE